MPNIKEVALKAGVSVATVSRVLSNKQNVRPEVREHVQKVMRELGYRPSRIAGNMRSQSSNVIGLMISDIRNPFFTAIARAIEDLANAHDMSVFLCNTDENPEKEQVYLKTLLEERVAGIILSPTQESASAFDFLIESGVPCVTIDRRVEGLEVDSVLSDNVQASYGLTQHLLHAGFRRIAAIIGLKNSTTGHERSIGFHSALKDFGLKAEERFFAYAYPRESEAEAIVDEWLRSETVPDAILTGNSRLTIGVLNAVQNAGLLIPKDIGLAGFDETPWMRHAASGITVISQPTYEMGKTAAELLFQRIIDPDRPQREVILKGTLLERGSSRRLR
jgi:LacI family fructose operon transcriptional repressor